MPWPNPGTTAANRFRGNRAWQAIHIFHASSQPFFVFDKEYDDFTNAKRGDC